MKRTTELANLCADELKKIWQEHYNTPPPAALGIDLLQRGVSWASQANEHCFHRHVLVQRLDKLSGDKNSGARKALIKPGTQLIREWQGQTYTVTAGSDHYLYAGERFENLSAIATKIAGCKWSGPRFFGLRCVSNRASAEMSDG